MRVKAERKDIYSFGQELLDSLDLDPVYVLLWNTQISRSTLLRWLLAYWSFYHVGTATWIASQEGNKFWKRFQDATESKAYPRGTERRHYRGKIAANSLAYLRSLGKSPEEIVAELTELPEGEESLSYPTVASRIKRWNGFGDWIAFKAGDMLERLRIVEVDFLPEDIFRMFDSPRKGAELLAEKEGWKPSDLYPNPCSYAYGSLAARFGTAPAPPSRDRGCAIQEFETILCKWKSHCGGHYEVGKDSKEIREALMRFPRNPLVQKLYKAGRRSLWEKD